MLPSEPYLYHSVVNISNVLKVTKIKLITNKHYYVIIKTDHAESLECTSHYEIKQCCHFLITKCKIFKLLIKPLFLRLFEPDQSEIKEIFYEIVNIHSEGNFQQRNTLKRKVFVSNRPQISSQASNISY